MSFSFTHNEPLTNNEPLQLLPDGWYTAMIVNSEVKDTKKKQEGLTSKGQYIEFTFEIVGPRYKGRKVWTRINVENDNERAVEIGHKDLANICKSMGLAGFQDPTELHDNLLDIKVETEESKNGYAPSNIIRGYKKAVSAGNDAPSQPTAQATEQKAAASTSAVKPSWAS